MQSDKRAVFISEAVGVDDGRTLYSAVQVSPHLSVDSRGPFKWQAFVLGDRITKAACEIPTADGLDLRIGRLGERERLFRGRPIETDLSKRLRRIAENRIEVVLNPPLSPESLPIFITQEVDDYASYDVVIRLAVKRLGELSQVVRSIAFIQKQMTTLTGGAIVPGSSVERLKELALNTGIAEGFVLPVRRDVACNGSVICLDSASSDDAFNGRLVILGGAPPLVGETLMQMSFADDELDPAEKDKGLATIEYIMKANQKE